MKRKTTGFLDLDLVSPKSRHPIMRELLKVMRKEVGNPCRTFGSRCASCEIWLAFHRLDMFFDSGCQTEKK